VTITLREILWIGFWLAVFMAFLFGDGFPPGDLPMTSTP
jgi:hypothetical protein